jgi:hypothetical protein
LFELLWLALQDVKTRNANSKTISEWWRKFFLPLAQLSDAGWADKTQLISTGKLHHRELFRRS